MFGQTIKNFNIHFQRRDGSNVYSSGDLMTGKISFELIKECVINSITLTLKGKAKVAWRKGGKKRRGVSAKVVYFNFKNVIMMNREAAVQFTFPPGTHVYPFTCQIPQGDFPSSFKGVAGQIAYTLIVGFDRPWHLTKEFETEVNFANRCNLTYELMAPLSGSNSMTVCSLWCASGTISINVRLERAAFLPGEEVKIMCECSNSSSRPATTKARLLQKQMFYTLNHVQHRKFEQTLARQTGLVGPHSPEAQSELTITIPSTVPFSISNCAILEVSYVIEVCFSVKYSPDLTVLCPIVIGNLRQDSLAPPPHVPSCEAMEDTVKDFSVSYNRINNEDTFTGGDFISGNIKLELSKDCKINSLYVQIKGKAKVLWSEDHGRTSTVYSSTEKFLSIKQSVIQELKGQESQTVGQGCYAYPFNFQIPSKDLPSSFKSFTGKIQYRVKAYLSRSMSRDSKANAPFTVISKASCSPEMMIPQHSTKDQKLRLFNSGKVTMDVHINKMAFCQGEAMQVTAYIQNSSSRDIKPKYCLYLKTSFFANGKKKVKTKDLVKEVGEPIPPSAGQNVIRVITAPATTEVSILNCSIIKHEYRLKVYLDVKYQFDPEVDFPIVILPATASPGLGQPPADGADGGYGGYGFEAFGNPSPTSAASEPSAPPPPPSYGTYSLYPPLS